jgi:hypothetical protein
MNNMFNFSTLAANVLNSLDNAAKDTLEEPRISATALRSKRLPKSKNDELSDEEDDTLEQETHFQDAPSLVSYLFSYVT